MQTGLLETVRLSNQSLRIMTAMLTEVGIDPQPILSSLNLDPSVIEDPQGEISGANELRFQQAFAEATSHIPGLWMQTGLRYRLMSYGPLGLAVLAATDVAEGLQVLGAFQALTFSLMHYNVEESDGQPVALAADESRVPEAHREFHQERALGSVTMFLNDMLQRRFPLQRIESTLNRPADWQSCDALLGTPVRFDAPVTRWIFEEGVGARPLPMANQLLEETYQRLCSKLVKGAPHGDEFLNKVYEVMVRSGRGFPAARAAAAQLGLSERTLHRRLKAQSTSFGQIIDNVRVQRAKDLLEQSTFSVERISDMLGFAEIASFSRAFKRLTGDPPSAHRRKRLY